MNTSLELIDKIFLTLLIVILLDWILFIYIWIVKEDYLGKRIIVYIPFGGYLLYREWKRYKNKKKGML